MLSIFAGLVISIAGLGLLKVGTPIGAITFCWGLITIILFKLELYTGKAGFLAIPEQSSKLFLILLGNIIGCVLGSMLFVHDANMIAAAQEIVKARLSASPLPILMSSIGCGIIMTIAVYCSTRLNNYLPLIFGIPLFILCGFPHSIADCFYIFSCKDIKFIGAAFFPWVISVIGNFIGCNIPRFYIMKMKKREE